MSARKTSKKYKSRKRGNNLQRSKSPGVKSDRNRSKRTQWKRLKHNGPLFPDEYKRLPRNVSLLYKGRKVALSKKAEEAASLYAKVIRDKISKRKRFQEHFFEDWKDVMTPAEKKRITDFKSCNFELIHYSLLERANLKRERERKDKASILKKKQQEREKYGFCTMDGKKQAIANYKIEPPSIFRGRGENKLKGRIKPRVLPGDVTINIGKGERIPKPSTSGSWKEVIHDNKLSWTAAWTDKLTRKKKYIYTGPSSNLRVLSDIEKFEKARDLHGYIGDIRRNYLNGCRSKSIYDKQRSLALFFIDRLALRVGNETGPTSAETYGCCSLQKKHIQLSSKGRRHFIQLKFKSKDSIIFNKKVEISPIVYDALKECTDGKGPREQILDLVTPTVVNNYLYTIDAKMTAKVFRTYNASVTFQYTLFAETSANMDLEEKLLSLDKACIAAAELCNHKKEMPKSHPKVMRNLSKRIENAEEQLDELEDREDGPRIADKIAKTEDRLYKLEIQKERKVLTADFNLNTGKTNYIDPRIVVAWAKTFDVPMSKVFTPTQMQKFKWAAKTKKTYVF